MTISSLLKLLLTALLLSMVLSACQRQPIRHYSSDVSLLLPGSTTKQEVLAYLGTPEEQRVDPREGEMWIYYQVNKSLLRKTPLLGKRMGREQYEVVIVTFQGEVVRTNTYRSLDRQEFEQAGILQGESPGN
jgi:outer membrane protein assembly factor BamE (lipoprotein component of BamABCDE complex)